MWKDNIELWGLEELSTENTWDITLDLLDEVDPKDDTLETDNDPIATDSTADINKVDELLSEASPAVAEEVIPETDADIVEKETETETDSTDNNDDILDELMSELDSSKEVVEKIEAAWDWSSELSLLTDSLKRMEDQIKKLNNEKVDLTLRNAELETFWSDSTDPNILILSKHLDKAKAWDDRSKQKVSTIIKEMLYDLTWEDYDKTNINNNIDTLSASESYNTKTNPNLTQDEKRDDDFGLSI